MSSPLIVMVMVFSIGSGAWLGQFVTSVNAATECAEHGKFRYESRLLTKPLVIICKAGGA